MLILRDRKCSRKTILSLVEISEETKTEGVCPFNKV